MTTEYDVARWFREGKEKGCTHLMVVCNTLTGDDYPIFVLVGENPRRKATKYGDLDANGRPTLPNKKGQKVLEVYSLKRNMEQQLNENRTFHLE